jgi:hypothetical protein
LARCSFGRCASAEHFQIAAISTTPTAKIARLRAAIFLRKFWQILWEIPRLPNARTYLRLQAQRRSIGVREGQMKKDDARLGVLREYDRWAKEHPSSAQKMGGFVFFSYLQKEKPDLLDFRAVGSKWQIVHDWLSHGGRLED